MCSMFYVSTITPLELYGTVGGQTYAGVRKVLFMAKYPTKHASVYGNGVHKVIMTAMTRTLKCCSTKMITMLWMLIK